jgi:hypothetical protein
MHVPPKNQLLRSHYDLDNWHEIDYFLSPTSLETGIHAFFEEDRECKDLDGDTHYINDEGYLITRWFSPDQIKKEEERFNYTFNKNGFRSQHFKTLNKDNVNVVFIGCSNTLGQGLPDRLQWTTQVETKIKELNPAKTVEAYNLGHVGLSIIQSLRLLKSFIFQYGVPDYVFFLAPDTARSVKYHPGIEKMGKFPLDSRNITAEDPYLRKFTLEFCHEDAIFTAVNELQWLELYCAAAGIRLVWSTWYEAELDILNKLPWKDFLMLDRNFDAVRISADPTPYYENVNNLPYWKAARDDAHSGSCWTTYIAKSFSEEVTRKWFS